MDLTTFKEQILCFSNKSFRLAKSILKNADKAQDAVQELNAKLWEKKNSLHEVENMSAFVMRSMRNLCLDTLKQNHTEYELDEKLEYNEPNPYQYTEKNDTTNKIHSIIDNLPEIQRNVIRLRDVEGMEINEIAYIMQMTENAVNVNLSRARLKVRERIKKLIN